MILSRHLLCSVPCSFALLFLSLVFVLSIVLDSIAFKLHGYERYRNGNRHSLKWDVMVTWLKYTRALF